MKLKISLFKKGLIINDLKRFWWISAIYTLALLFILPLNHYMQKFDTSSENLDWLKESVRRDLLFENTSSQIFLLFIPVIIAVLVFRYIQKSNSASLYHSLPVTRAALYLNSMASSLILFISPLLVTTSVMFLLNGFSYLSSCYSAALIITWLLYSLLFGIMFLSMAAFVGMFTGSSVAQLAFVYILNLLPVFLFESARINLSMILYGFSNFTGNGFYYKMPMLMLYYNRYENFTPSLIMFFVFLTIAFWVGGLIAFKLRKPETAGDIITFKAARPLFIFGVTICGMLLCGAYSGAIGRSSSGFLILGYFASTLIFYAAVQMITNKSLKILHAYKGYICFALVLAALLLGIRFDIFGYVNKVPDPAEVEEVYIGNNISYWLSKAKPLSTSTSGNWGEVSLFRESENIEKVTRLHRLILENRSTEGFSSHIAYKLKNGKNIIRAYPVDTDLYASALGPIYESQEYKDGRFPILHQEAENLKYIEIHDSRSEKLPFVVSDKVQLESFKTALRKDVENLSYGEMISQSQRIINIKIVDTSNSPVIYDLRSDFSNTLGWLKKEGIYDQVVLTSEDVISAGLENPSSPDGNIKNVEITDKKLIQELLDQSLEVDYIKGEPGYLLYFTKKRGSNTSSYSFIMYFGKNVSAELQTCINKIK